MKIELACLTLSKIKTYGPKRINDLLRRIDVSTIDKPVDFIQKISSSGLKIKVPNLEELESSFDNAITTLNSLENTDINLTTILSEDYPFRLKEGVEDPPTLIFYKGKLENISEKAVAIVGTRNPTNESIEIANNLTTEMAKRGYCIVSGLAKGIDTVAHKGALKNKVSTVAVLAHGLNTVYPKENIDLASSILENGGVLLSEYPPDEGIAPYQFVARDRIQSALSTTVFVVQTKVDGGTMKTANFANKQGRELYVYSEKGPEFEGNEQLISEGAKTFSSDVAKVTFSKQKKAKSSEQMKLF